MVLEEVDWYSADVSSFGLAGALFSLFTDQALFGGVEIVDFVVVWGCVGDEENMVLR